VCGNPACRKKCVGFGSNHRGGPPEFDGDVCYECDNLVIAARLAKLGLVPADMDAGTISKIDALHASLEAAEEQVTAYLFVVVDVVV